MSNIDEYKQGREIILNMDYADFEEVKQPELPNPESELNLKIYKWGLVFGIVNSLFMAYVLGFGTFMQFKESQNASFYMGAIWFLMACIFITYPVFTIYALRRVLSKIKQYESNTKKSN